MKRAMTAIGMSAVMVLAVTAGAVAENPERNGNQGAIWSLHCIEPTDDPSDGCASGYLTSGQEWSDGIKEWSKSEHKGGVSEGVHSFKENGPEKP